MRAGVAVVVLLAAVVVGGDADGVGGRAQAAVGHPWSSASTARDADASSLPRVPRASAGLVGLIGGGFDALGTRLRRPDGGVDGMALAAPVDPAAAGVAPAGATGAAPAPAPDVAITPPPRAAFADAGAPPPVVRPEPTRYPDVTPSGGTWALVIGVNDYPGAQYDLRSAVNDAQDVDEALRRAGVTPDRRMLLRDGDATSGKIRGGLDWVTAHAGPDATIVVFYAGHVQKLASRTEAFVGSDGGVVTDAEVAELLDRSPASRAWIAIAGCYAAGFDEVVKPGRILTAAAPADSLAYENSSFGRSYLVEYMVRRAMLRDGLLTIEAAFERAAEQLRREYPDRVPVQFDSLAGDLDLRAAAGGPSGGSGGGSGGPTAPPPSSPPPSSPPPTQPDGCADLTVGVVRCSRG